jgi:hypothetical protein
MEKFNPKSFDDDDHGGDHGHDQDHPDEGEHHHH